MKIVIPALIVVADIFLVERWKWTECRQVGHGVLYCLVK